MKIIVLHVNKDAIGVKIIKFCVNPFFTNNIFVSSQIIASTEYIITTKLL